MAPPERFELPTFWFEARHSGPLSYGGIIGMSYRPFPGYVFDALVSNQRLTRLHPIMFLLVLAVDVRFELTGRGFTETDRLATCCFRPLSQPTIFNCLGIEPICL